MPIPPGHVRCGPLRCIPSLLREFGVDPVATSAAVGLDISIFDDSERPVPYETVLALLDRAAFVTHCDYFGLLAGIRCNLEDLGAVGLLAAHAPTVGTALNDLATNIVLFDKVTTVSLTEVRPQAHLMLSVVRSPLAASTHFLDACLAIAVRVIRQLAGETWCPGAALFPHPAPVPVRPYADFFRAPLVFGADMAGLSFPSHWLDHPVAMHNHVMRRHLETYISLLSHDAHATVTDKVRSRVNRTVSFGQVSEESIARSLGMDTSTLRRRLARENTSYRRIIEDAGRERAQHLMRIPGFRLSQVAEALGYTELSVFTRAYRRWTGMTPSEWRRQAGLTNRPIEAPIKGRS